MIDLVLFHKEKNQLKLYRLGKPYYQVNQWLGEPFLPWRTLEIAIDYGWEVVGEM